MSKAFLRKRHGNEMRFMCIYLWILHFPPSKNFQLQHCAVKRICSSKKLLQQMKFFLFSVFFLHNIFMQTIFSLIKFNISWGWCLEYSLVGNHFQEYYSIRLPKKRWGREMNIARAFSCTSPALEQKNFSCWILFHEASGDAQGGEEREWSRRRNRLRKLWCSWDNKNNIKISN